MQIKEERISSNNQNSGRISGAEHNVKQESGASDFNMNWNERAQLDIFNQDSGRPGNPIDLSSKPNPQEKAQNPDNFKRLELAFMWEKRIPKNEILLMNLA